MLRVRPDGTDIDGLNPHVWFFRKSFSSPEVVRDLLVNYLPPPMVEELALETLEILEHPRLRKDEESANLVFRIETARRSESHVLVLLRLASIPDPRVPLRLLDNMCLLREEALEGDDNAPLPFIVPVVLYHGPEPWNVPLQLREVRGTPEPWVRYQPDFRYLLLNLSLSGGPLVR